MSDRKTSRRGFLKKAALTGAGLGALQGAPLAGVTPQAKAAADSGASASTKPHAKVPRKPLGTTGEEIPILVLGCAQKFDPKYDKILHRCFRAGVDYLDTALVYADGMSHKTIAPFIKQIGDRKKLWITSKGPGRQGTVESFESEFEQCLSGLEIDYLDLFFMHALDNTRFLDPEFIKMGERMRKSGKTRFFGFSCHGDKVVDLMNKAVKVGGIDAIMFRYSFARYGDLALNKAIDACKEAGIGLIAMKTQESVPDDLEAVAGFKSKDFTLGQAKLKAVWADERIDSAVSHIDNTKKLKENVDAARSPVQLSMEDFQQLQSIARATAHYSCTGCSRHCEPKVDGEVNIADTMRFLMYHESYGESEKARAFYRALPPAQRAIDGLDFTAASAACPQGIDIAARLNQARKFLG